MVPWLPKLLEVAKIECGFDTALLTNGLLWTEARTAQIAPFVDYVAVSLDGATADTHDRIRGAGAFERTLAALPRLNKAGLRIVLSVTLMKSNLRDISENLAKLVDSFDFPVDVDFANFITEGRGTTFTDEPVGAKLFQETLSKLVKPLLANDWKPLPLSQRRNCGYGSAFAIYANGDVSPCLSPRFIRGNLRTTSISELFTAISSEAEAAEVERLPLCQTCELRLLCGGRCHLHQLTRQLAPTQNECTSEYRVRFRNSLVGRFDEQRSQLDHIVGQPA
jgi:radical SAM protein with 4Fe4S-binding SPASM domain